RRIRTSVLTSDTKTTIASHLAAAINATPGLPVTAEIDSDDDFQINLTAVHAGTLGNTVAIENGVITEDGGLAASLLTITAMASGAGDPDLETAFNNLGDDEFDWIASPYADSTNIG